MKTISNVSMLQNGKGQQQFKATGVISKNGNAGAQAAKPALGTLAFRTSNETLGDGKTPLTKAEVATHITNAQEAKLDALEKADDMSSAPDGSMSGGGPAGSVMSDLVSKYAISDVLTGIVTRHDPRNHSPTVCDIYRDMYYHDPTTGSAIELLATVPFSDFTLTGVRDEKMARVFLDSTESMNCEQLLPNISVEYNCVGGVILSTRWDETSRAYRGVTPHRIDYATFTQVPVFGIDPIIEVKIPPYLADALNRPEIKERYSDLLPDFLLDDKGNQNKNAGGTVLKPEDTIFIPRRAFLKDFSGVSLLRRALPAWLYEKALIRGTIDQVYKRQRAIGHVTVEHSEEWTPTPEEMNYIASMFLNADLDPLGSILVTRAGVNYNEVRRGDDFLKWCLTGDTLIPTQEYGLIRIDKLVEEKEKVFTTLGGEGIAQSRDTWYSGVKPVYELTTNHGNRIRATNKHGFLVLQDDLSLEWKPLGKLNIGDKLCLSSKEIHRNTELPLNPVFSNYGNEKQINIPNTMNPDLAYIIGLLVSEGQYSKYDTRFGNTDQKINGKYKRLMQKVFGLVPKFSAVNGSGYSEFAGKRFYASYISSKLLSEFWQYLGLTNKSSDEKSPSHHKEIPWSILEADVESQKAFLAAYIDGDGHVNNRLISVYSVSKSILYQMQTLFATFGIMSHISFRGKKGCLTLNKEAAYKAYSLLDPYLIDKAKMQEPMWPNGVGMPTTPIVTLLKSRRVKGKQSIYLDDKGNEIYVEGSNVINRDFRKTWISSHYKKGYYDNLLRIIKQVSKNMYQKVIELFAREYDFAEVTKIEYLGYQPTYDISMNKKYELSFTANGIVVHNTDAYDIIEKIKLRALGISESFVSAEVTYSQMDHALSVFMENVKDYRNRITRELFYEKVFLRISMANGYTKKKNNDLLTTEIASMYGGSGIYYNDRNELTVHVNSDTPVAIPFAKEYAANIFGAQASEYLIPTVVWRKRLMPEADDAYMSVLSLAEEKGVPITMRHWIAAAGLQPDTLMQGLNDDLRLRERIYEYMQELNELKKEFKIGGEGDSAEGGNPGQGGGDDGEEFARFMINQKFGRGSTIPRRSLLSRANPDSRQAEIANLDHKGERRVSTRKGREVKLERFNKIITEASINVAQRENHATKLQEIMLREQATTKIYTS